MSDVHHRGLSAKERAARLAAQRRRLDAEGGLGVSQAAPEAALPDPEVAAAYVSAAKEDMLANLSWIAARFPGGLTYGVNGDEVLLQFHGSDPQGRFHAYQVMSLDEALRLKIM